MFPMKWTGNFKCGDLLFQDVPLFEGIISDLFPGVECPKPDYGVFMEALKENTRKRKLQCVPWFLDKIIQVPWTIILFDIHI